MLRQTLEKSRVGESRVESILWQILEVLHFINIFSNQTNIQMILKLAHTKLDIFKISKQVVLSIYKLTQKFPNEEKFAMTSQIRRAVTSVHLNIAEGSARKTAKEKCRFYEISRSSLVEVDTILDLAFDLQFIDNEDVKALEDNIVRCFQMLSGMIDYNSKIANEK